MKKDEYYPSLICFDCGNKFGTVIPGHVCTLHENVCGWCQQFKAVTEPRDFKYPKFHGMNVIVNDKMPVDEIHLVTNGRKVILKIGKEEKG